ncbi:MAG: hypothetical protein RMM08_03265 [Armatimonadota bacterium]|nr:hypothetical protein [bacterium]MDW8320361.1 hypothetical protein [Armatimonadota bacterium]
MKRSTWIAICGATALIAALLVMWRAAATPTPPEEQVVRERLEEIRAAIEERDLNTVMDAISNDFEAFGYSRERLRLEIASAFRRGTQPHVSYTISGVSLVGKEAVVNMHVEVWWEEQGLVSRHEPTAIQVKLRKEPARKWLVFPTEKWRVIDVEGINIDGLE